MLLWYTINLDDEVPHPYWLLGKDCGKWLGLMDGATSVVRSNRASLGANVLAAWPVSLGKAKRVVWMKNGRARMK